MIDIDDDVAALTEELQALRELGRADNVEDAGADQVYDLSIRWGAALAGRLPRLVHYSSLGLLDDAGQREFHTLCTQLREVSDLVQRFGLARPRLPDG